MVVTRILILFYFVQYFLRVLQGITDTGLGLVVVPLAELELSDEAVHPDLAVGSRHFLEAGDDALVGSKIFVLVRHSFPEFVFFVL